MVCAVTALNITPYSYLSFKMEVSISISLKTIIFWKMEHAEIYYDEIVD